MMTKTLTIGTILLSVSLLTGCWGATIHGDKPNEYIETKNTIDSLYGSTREDIIRKIGKPKWTENRGGSTIFIYEWQRTDKMVGFFVLPIPVGGGIIYVDLYCLLLEFDEANNLVNHESVSDSDGNPAEWGIADFAYKLSYKKDLDCIDILSKPIWYLIDGTGMFCPDELGHTHAQMRIGDIFYDGYFGVEVDIPRAYVWYSLASTSGNKGALRSLDKIEKMPPALVTEAQKLLEQWKPKHCSSELISRHRKLIQKEHIERDRQPVENELAWRVDRNNIKTYCTNADSGNADAQKHIGDLYFFGADVINTDLIRAYVWYNLTASNGDKEAIKQIHLLENVLSQSQLGEAVRQTLDWKPGQCERYLMERIEQQSEVHSGDTRKRAEDSDAKAMYRVYKNMRDEYIDPVSAWEWLCKAADLGYENAQIEAAYWHRESNWEFLRSDRVEWLRKAKIRTDDRVAYLWYTLAAKGDGKRLWIRDNLFSETLSKEEIAEAEDMVINWKPGQCPTHEQ